MTTQRNPSDTPIEGVSSLTFPRGLINFSSDFKLTAQNPTEIKLSHIGADLDRPEVFRMGYSVVPDIYRGTEISVSAQAPSKKGISLLIQLTDIWRETDAASKITDLPISAHLVIKVPAHSAVTADSIQAHVGRLVSALFETGSTATTRIASMLRGSLSPTGV